MIALEPLPLQSFKPIVDDRSRILILGTMPGPESLRKKEYYGFPGNQFWRILAAIFKVQVPNSYPEKIQLLRVQGIALWDVFASCQRPGAADHAIRSPTLNLIPELLIEYPKIRMIALNGQTAEKVFRKHFAPLIKTPFFGLPSTSPANARTSFQGKLKAWSVITHHL